MTSDRSDPQRRLPWEETEVDAAADAAGAIGGRADDEDVNDAERPLKEAGEGEAEGFALAEQDLIEVAETGYPWLDAAFPAESEEGLEQAYGEPDQEFSSELPDDDR